VEHFGVGVEAGKSAVFAANEDYREGRPFADSIEFRWDGRLTIECWTWS